MKEKKKKRIISITVGLLTAMLVIIFMLGYGTVWTMLGHEITEESYVVILKLSVVSTLIGLAWNNLLF